MIIANWKSNIVDIDQWTHDFHDEYIVNERLQSTIFGVAPPCKYILKKIRWMKQIHHVFDDGELGFQEVFCGVQDVDHSYGSRTGAISVDMVLTQDVILQSLVIQKEEIYLMKIMIL